MAENYDGLSLRWVRHIVGAQAAWPSARSAADDLELTEVGPGGVVEIPVGAVVFYDHGPWADVGIAVGERLVLRRKHGVVMVELLDGKWVMGWVSGEDFRAAAAERRADSQHG
jgi:hypothetical protein